MQISILLLEMSYLFFYVFFCSSQTTVHQHYDQSHQASLSYDSYGGVIHSSGGAERPPSGTPSTSVHSSPGRHQGNKIQGLYKDSDTTHTQKDESALLLLFNAAGTDERQLVKLGC